MADGKKRQVGLEHQVRMVERELWPTPTVHGNYNRAGASANAGDGLETAVKMLPTPRAADGMSHSLRNPKNIKNPRGRLEDYVSLYPTITANDAKNNAPPSQHVENGRHSNPLNVVAGGALNPQWVGWLMGFPTEWLN
jgi:DNA (cytosine-5)-methyltransferase 1